MEGGGQRHRLEMAASLPGPASQDPARPLGRMVEEVDQLLRRNTEIIAAVTNNQAARDPAKLNVDNVRLLQELDVNLDKVRVGSSGSSFFFKHKNQLN